MSNRHTDQTADDLEWVTVDDGGSRLRRAARRLAAVGVVALLLVTATVSMTGGVTAQTTFTANDVSATTATGDLTALSVAPTGTVEYAGLESQPSSVDVVVQVRPQGGAWKTVSSKSLSTSGLSGTVDYDFDRVDLLSTLPKGRLPTAPDGDDASTTLEVRVEATLVGAGPGGDDVTASSTDSFTVTVHNRKAGGSVGGRANTNAN